MAQNQSEYQQWLNVVRINGNDLIAVPHSLRNEEMCMAALTQNVAAVRFVPRDLRSKSGKLIHFFAVEKRGWALQFIKDEDITPDLCMAAVQQAGDSLSYIPRAMRSRVVKWDIFYSSSTYRATPWA